MSEKTTAAARAYLPDSVRSMKLREVGVGEVVAAAAQGRVLVRNMKLRACAILSGQVVFDVDGLGRPCHMPDGDWMTFGDERRTARQYAMRVLERGDRIDAVVEQTEAGGDPLRISPLQISMFWIHIVYEGARSETGSFSRKDDGQFAMRAKAGEKAERVVLRDLARSGHDIDPALLVSPGVFTIRYAGKRDRKPDGRCRGCGALFEVKKRNQDTRLRISHSNGRPFGTENRRGGWHAFVFPDMRPRYVSNNDIMAALDRNAFTPGSDRYDAWAELSRDAVTVHDHAPVCPCRAQKKSNPARETVDEPLPW